MSFHAFLALEPPTAPFQVSLGLPHLGVPSTCGCKLIKRGGGCLPSCKGPPTSQLSAKAAFTAVRLRGESPSWSPSSLLPEFLLPGSLSGPRRAAPASLSELVL